MQEKLEKICCLLTNRHLFEKTCSLLGKINSKNKPCFFSFGEKLWICRKFARFCEKRLYGVNEVWNLKIYARTSVFYFEPTKWSSKSVFRVLGHQPSGYWLIRWSMLHFLLQYIMALEKGLSLFYFMSKSGLA